MKVRDINLKTLDQAVNNTMAKQPRDSSVIGYQRRSCVTFRIRSQCKLVPCPVCIQRVCISRLKFSNYLIRWQTQVA